MDIEPVRRGRFTRELALSVLNEPEIRAVDAAPDPDVAFLRQWVRREALVKVGALTLDTLRTADLSRLPPGEPAGSWAAHGWGRYVIADWRSGPALGAVAARRAVPLLPLASRVLFEFVNGS